MSLIPTATGSATAIGLIYPELPGKLNGVAIRVPLLSASLTDRVFEVDNGGPRSGLTEISVDVLLRFFLFGLVEDLVGVAELHQVTGPGAV